jgi:hypothetical protein
MGQQQLLLLIFGVIIVGVTIAVSSTMYDSSSISSNKDGIISSMMTLASNAYEFRLRPVIMGGGGGKYSGYIIPERLRSNDDGSFTTASVSKGSITFKGVSLQNAVNTITVILDSTGTLNSFTYSGDFQ